MWLDKNNVSEFAYYSCLEDKKKSSKMYGAVLLSKWAYYYCRDIEDIEDVWKKITDPKWAYYYCININDRQEVRNYIIGSWKERYKAFSSNEDKKQLNQQLGQTIDRGVKW